MKEYRGSHDSSLFWTDSDFLIQQTWCDPVTPGCQGASGGAMAAGTRVEENQLQRIIRDLHGTSALCVCVYCNCTGSSPLLTDMAWLRRRERGVGKLWFRDLYLRVYRKSLTEGNRLICLCQQIFWKRRHLTSCLCNKGVVAVSVSMQRDSECVLRVHPSRVSFQFLRWIKGKFLYKKGLYWKRVVVELEF